MGRVTGILKKFGIVDKAKKDTFFKKVDELTKQWNRIDSTTLGLFFADDDTTRKAEKELMKFGASFMSKKFDNQSGLVFVKLKEPKSFKG